LLESESIIVTPKLGAAPGSGDLVYTLAVVGKVTMKEIRDVLEDAFLLHLTHLPPMKYLLCRSTSLADVTVKTREIGRLLGVESVTLSLNRELFFSRHLVRKLTNQRIEDLTRDKQ